MIYTIEYIAITWSFASECWLVVVTSIEFSTFEDFEIRKDHSQDEIPFYLLWVQFFPLIQLPSSL